MKVLLLVFISMAFFHTPMTAFNAFGMAVSLIAFCCYNGVRYYELKTQRQTQQDIEFTQSVVNKLLTEQDIQTEDEEDVSE